MAITVEELPDSRQWTTGANLSVEFSYQVRGTASDIEAKNAMLGEAPSSYQYLARQSSQIEPVVMDTANPDGCIWKGTVRYARASQTSEPPETGESTFSFDTGGGTQHVTQSISTVNKYAPAGKTAPDFKGAVERAKRTRPPQRCRTGMPLTGRSVNSGIGCHGAQSDRRLELGIVARTFAPRPSCPSSPPIPP